MAEAAVDLQGLALEYLEEQRRRDASGLPPIDPENETREQRLQRVAYETLFDKGPDTSVDPAYESARGLGHLISGAAGAAGATVESVGGLAEAVGLGGGPLKRAGQQIQAFGTEALPPPGQEIEGVPGAVIEGLGGALVELPKLQMAMAVGPGGVFGRIGTFGALASAESAGLQQSREHEISFDETLKAGRRGATMGAAFEAVAPFGILARAVGLGGYGWVEPVLFDPETTSQAQAESAATTGMMGLLGPMRGTPGPRKMLEPPAPFIRWKMRKANGKAGEPKDTFVDAAKDGDPVSLEKLEGDLPEIIDRTPEPYKGQTVDYLQEADLRNAWRTARRANAYQEALAQGEVPAEAIKAGEKAVSALDKTIDLTIKGYNESAGVTSARIMEPAEAKSVSDWVASQQLEPARKKKIRSALEKMAAGEKVPKEELADVMKMLGEVSGPRPEVPAEAQPQLAPEAAVLKRAQDVAARAMAQAKEAGFPDPQMIGDQVLSSVMEPAKAAEAPVPTPGSPAQSAELIARGTSERQFQQRLAETGDVAAADVAARETYAAEHSRMRPEGEDPARAAGRLEKEGFAPEQIADHLTKLKADRTELDFERKRVRQEWQDMFGLEEQAARDLGAYTDAWAKTLAAESGTRMADWYKRLSIQQGGEGPAKAVAVTRHLQNGNRVISALGQKATVREALHELAHVFRGDLAGRSLELVETELGVKNGKWTRPKEEAFAKAHEGFVTTGKTRKKGLLPILERFNRWLGNLYDSTSKVGTELSPKMREFLESRFSFDEIVPTERTSGDVRSGGTDVLFAMDEAGTSYGMEQPVGPPPGTKTRGLWGETAGKALSYWSESYIRMIRSVMPALGNRMQLAVDSMNKYMGQFSDGVRAVERSVKDASWTDGRDLTNPIENGEFSAFTKFQQSAEGKKAWYNSLSSGQKKIVDAHGKLFRGTGKAAEDLKIKKIDGTDFKAREDGSLLIRRPTRELWNILERGARNPNDPLFVTLKKAVIEANPGKVNAEGVDQVIRSVDILAKRWTLEKKAAFEFERSLPEFPTHIREGRGSKWIPVLDSNPVSAARSMAQSTSARLGVVIEFGQGFDFRAYERPFVAQSNRGVIEATNIFSDAMRALNGIPLEQSRRTLARPGTKSWEVTRWISVANTGLRALNLTRSAVVNTTELVGNLGATAGQSRMIRAFYEIAKNPKDIALETARMGGRTRDTVAMIADPSRIPETIGQGLREFLLRGTGGKYVNEINELVAAQAGRVMARDLEAGRASSIDRFRLEHMLQFTKAEVGDMLGDAAARSSAKEAGLYDAVTTRMAEVTQGTTSRPVQRSQAANSAMYNRVVAFDSYGQMSFDRYIRVLQGARDVITEANATGNWSKVPTAMRFWGYSFAGKSASGIGAMFLRAMAIGGLAGGAAFWRESADDRAEALARGFMYATFGGPLEAVWRAGASADSKSAAEQLVEGIYPMAKTMEMLEFWRGAGRYKNKGWLDKAGTFLYSQTPVLGTVPGQATLAMIGLGERDRAREVAISSYWRWRRDEGTIGEFSGKKQEKDGQLFRQHMAKAYSNLRGQKSNDEITEHLVAALQDNGGDTAQAAKSIRSRKLLAGQLSEMSKAVNWERIQALKKRIGEENYQLLLKHDALLEAWASAL